VAASRTLSMEEVYVAPYPGRCGRRGGFGPPARASAVEQVLAQLDPSLPHARRADVARAPSTRPSRGEIGPEDVVREAADRARSLSLGLLDRVVNATGVLLHTNLGRAPLGTDALAAMARSSGYTNLEYRLADAERAARATSTRARRWRVRAEPRPASSSTTTRAAVLLVLTALARDRAVLVVRGELVEIGGGFRIPEILAESGARLVEVGTTNKTRIADYERAWDR